MLRRWALFPILGALSSLAGCSEDQTSPAETPEQRAPDSPPVWHTVEGNGPPGRFLADDYAVSNELLAFMEDQVRTVYARQQSRYTFDDDATREELLQVSARVKQDFAQWIGERRHVEQIADLEVTPLVPRSDAYTLRYVVFQNANRLTVRGMLAVPRKGEGPFPVVMIMRGGGVYTTFSDFAGERGAPFNGTPDHLARKYVVMAVEIPLQQRDHTAWLSNVSGVNWELYQICDKTSSALDYLQTLAEADTRRVAVYGISSGGWAALTAGACGDPRIDVVVASGTNVWTNIVVQLLDHRRFIYPYYYLLNAVRRPDRHVLPLGFFPRPIIMELNSADPTGDYPIALRNARRVKRFYELLGAGDDARLVLVSEPSCRHCMFPRRIEPLLAALFRRPSSRPGAAEKTPSPAPPTSHKR